MSGDSQPVSSFGTAAVSRAAPVSEATIASDRLPPGGGCTGGRPPLRRAASTLRHRPQADHARISGTAMMSTSWLTLPLAYSPAWLSSSSPPATASEARRTCHPTISAAAAARTRPFVAAKNHGGGKPLKISISSHGNPGGGAASASG